MILWVMMDKSDELLLVKLYNEHRELLCCHANIILHDWHLSEDALHETFLRLIGNLDKIDENDCSRTKNFLLIVCENVAKDMYRERIYLNKSSDSIDKLEDSFEAIGYNPLDIVIDNESVDKIRNAVKELKPIYRDVLELKETYNYENTEIAHLLDLPLETVRKRLFRARKMLIQLLVKEDVG